jgi:hypothetical protein
MMCSRQRDSGGSYRANLHLEMNSMAHSISRGGTVFVCFKVPHLEIIGD